MYILRVQIHSLLMLVLYHKLTFHLQLNQMKLHFPRASKVFVCWPVLWAVTLFRFLKNNHEVRNTTAIEVFKSSRERSLYTKELELFRR